MKPMSEKKEYFKLFKSCMLVKGAKESIICDMGNTRIMPIPNVLYDILCVESKLDFNSFLELHKKHVALKDFIYLLILNRYGFLTKNNPQNVNLPIYSKKKLNISFVTFELNLNYDDLYIRNIINVLSITRCKNVQIIILEPFINIELLKILSSIDNKYINNIEIITPLWKDANHSDIKINLTKLFSLFPIINIIRIYNVNLDHFSNEYIDSEEKILVTSKKLNELFTNEVSKEIFVINNTSINEARYYNIGRFSKLFINVNGGYRNLIFDKTTIGNIDKILNINDFFRSRLTEYWELTKERVEICKDCQYRFICHDTCGFQTKNNIIYRDSKCSFNPYLNNWE